MTLVTFKLSNVANRLVLYSRNLKNTFFVKYLTTLEPGNSL